MGCTVVNRIDGGQRVRIGKTVVQASSSEVFANRLLRVVICDRDSTPEFRPVLHRPKIEQRLNTGNGGHARGVVGHQGHVAKSKTLTESFIVSEDERLVCFDRAAQRSSEDISLELRNILLVKEIPRVQCTVSE